MTCNTIGLLELTFASYGSLVRGVGGDGGSERTECEVVQRLVHLGTQQGTTSLHTPSCPRRPAPRAAGNQHRRRLILLPR